MNPTNPDVKTKLLERGMTPTLALDEMPEGRHLHATACIGWCANILVQFYTSDLRDDPGCWVKVPEFVRDSGPPAATAAAITDTERLDWLIEHGYTPARWRPWRPWQPGEPAPGSNGMVFLGRGDREEIDAAIRAPQNDGRQARGQNPQA